MAQRSKFRAAPRRIETLGTARVMGDREAVGGYFHLSADVASQFYTAQAAEALTFVDCDKSKQMHAFAVKESRAGKIFRPTLP